MLERGKMTECSCLALKLASCSGIYRSSVRKRGTNDGIVEISNRSNFLREKERGGEKWILWRTEDWKNSLLMVSKVGSVHSGVLDLPCIREKKKKN